VIQARPEALLESHDGELRAAAGFEPGSLRRFQSRLGRNLEPLFGVPEVRSRAGTARLEAVSGRKLPDLASYYTIRGLPDHDLELVAEDLLREPLVLSAYVKPPAIVTRWHNQVTPRRDVPPDPTPDYAALQGYLGPSPGGIGLQSAWNEVGGTGAGVRIIDVEYGWRFTHEDLRLNALGVIDGVSSTVPELEDHGTCVLGVLSGDNNAFGITGICPDAIVAGAAVSDEPGQFNSWSRAIWNAAQRLGPGDIIVIELQYPGPRYHYELRDDQLGYIPLEWWPDNQDALRHAVARGVLVVAAAANGNDDLDDNLYDQRPRGFPSTWLNPFRLGRATDTVIVGAGTPPPGTAGQDFGPDRSRLDFSNYGDRVDVQGWGEGVATSGGGDLQGGAGFEDCWYTERFAGTSSATPIVAGALACIQGVLRGRNEPPLSPTEARRLVRRVGSPQMPGVAGAGALQRIGPRPDLQAWLEAIADRSKIA